MNTPSISHSLEIGAHIEVRTLKPRTKIGTGYPIVVKELLDVVSPANGPRITTALLLAAGMGSRLHPLTNTVPKCLTEVLGIPILQRLIDNLRGQNFRRLIVVLGHLGLQIREFLDDNAGDLQIDYVVNLDYATTNNLYSLWLARNQISAPFMLVECDLVFNTELLDDLVYPGRAAISSLLPWMNGTTVELDAEDRITAFRPNDYVSTRVPQYKTVNIYSLSLNSWSKVEERLSQHVRNGELGEYYEVVFSDLIADGALTFDGVFFDSDLWYEIDSHCDLVEAESLFSRFPSISSERSGW